jgi:hypothetical protein
MNKDTFWWRLIHLNPVLFRSAVVTLVSLLAMFGVLVSPGLPDQLTAVITTVGAVVAALWSRDGVTPMEKVVVYQPDPVGAPKVVLPGEATADRTTDQAIINAARATPIE